MIRKRLSHMIILLGLLAPAGLRASDPPHDMTKSVQCISCHKTHTAAGGTLTLVAGNSNLCLSCHQAGGTASTKPFPPTAAALPNPGLPGTTAASGTSHRWDSGPAGHLMFGGGATTASSGTVGAGAEAAPGGVKGTEGGRTGVGRAEPGGVIGTILG